MSPCDPPATTAWAIEPYNTLNRERYLLAYALPHLRWRWHGVGMLQAYVHEGGPAELRAHIWCRSLALPGIDESGGAHNHRFDLLSVVLVGALEHTVLDLEEHPEGTHVLYDFPPARQHDDTNRTLMDRLPGRYRVRRYSRTIIAGQAYSFQRRRYHQTRPLESIVVTLVSQTHPLDERARVVAPINKPPVPAFGTPSQLPSNLDTILAEAKRLLLHGG